MSYIILDLDNCISDDAWRVNKIRWDIEPSFQRYHEYHMLSSFDEAHNTHLTNGHNVVISTSRPAFYEQITKCWLYRCGITPALLFMRKDGDYRPAITIKKEHYRYLIDVKRVLPEEIHCAYDDDPRVIAMYANLGVCVKHISINNSKQYERHKHAAQNSSSNSG